MIGFALRAAGLLAIYLLVLTSLAPGDVLVGSMLAIAIVTAARPHGRRPPAGWLRWSTALAGTLGATARDMIVGTVRTARFALGRAAAPGFVEIPRAGRSRRGVALWGVLTGEAPDEYPVDVDEPRDTLIVHILDARDPDAIVARHAAVRERWQRHVVS
jgi:multisubunit Na+/H+ antiporter MnhE subunit